MLPMTTLERTNTRATFFLAGGHIGAYESVVRRMDSLGLEIANHSWDHPDLTTLTTSQITAQLAITSTRIQQVTGDRPTLMRPPYGGRMSVGRSPVTCWIRVEVLASCAVICDVVRVVRSGWSQEWFAISNPSESIRRTTDSYAPMRPPARKNVARVLVRSRVVIGGIIGGIFTPTEGAAIAVLYAAALSLVYRTISIKDTVSYTHLRA